VPPTPKPLNIAASGCSSPSSRCTNGEFREPPQLTLATLATVLAGLLAALLLLSFVILTITADLLHRHHDFHRGSNAIISSIDIGKIFRNKIIHGRDITTSNHKRTSATATVAATTPATTTDPTEDIVTSMVAVKLQQVVPNLTPSHSSTFPRHDPSMPPTPTATDNVPSVTCAATP